MDIKTYRGVVFDKDGTLFDFAHTWESWAAAFLKRMAETDAHATELGRAIGFDLKSQKFDRESVVIAGTPFEIADALNAHLPNFSDVQILEILNEEAARAPQVEAVPLVPFLSGLRAAGFSLGVATNDAEAPAMAHLQSAGVTELFDFIVGADSGHGAKPAPGQLLGFATAVGLRPQECVMVGDSLHDLRAGRAAGFACVGVLTGLADAETLAPHADIVVPDIGHLPAWLGLREGL